MNGKPVEEDKKSVSTKGLWVMNRKEILRGRKGKEP